jgi:hypothetical protein
MENTFTSPIHMAAKLVGYDKLAKSCGVTRRAVVKWVISGHLPRTDWTGETNYAAVIDSLTDGEVSRSALLGTRRKSA